MPKFKSISDVDLKIMPRPYLSWSQFNLFEHSPERYAKVYFNGKRYENNSMTLGSVVDKAVEDQETNDPTIAHLMNFIPKYPKRQFEIPALSKNKKVNMGYLNPLTYSGIPVYGKLDGFRERPLTVGELKTGVKWTQGMVDKADQLTYYAMLVFSKFGSLPKDIFLHWAKTEIDDDGNVRLCGDVLTFRTERNMTDIVRLFARMKRTWIGIYEMALEEQKVFN